MSKRKSDAATKDAEMQDEPKLGKRLEDEEGSPYWLLSKSRRVT